MVERLKPVVLSGLLLLSLASSSRAGVPPQYANPSDAWLRSEEGRQVIGHVLTWQAARGGWPKNQDTASRPYEGDRNSLRGTFDNGATTSELRFLARACRATADQRYRQAFLKGLDHLLEAQYPTGGWPQSHPPGSGYPRHITFNDDAMVRILALLRELGEAADYAFVEGDRRLAARAAFDRGIQCILDCQIVVDHRRTVWCAQHDAVDLRPRPARAYELESLSGAESASILKLLMSLDDPSPEVQRAIRAGAAWFETVKITGLRIDRVEGDRVVVQDPGAPPLWARFYEIGTDRPFFCGRDGVKKYRLSEIEAERRNGYAWYGGWGEEVAQAYDAWKQRFPLRDPTH